MKSMPIRDAEEGDLPGILAIYNEVVATSAAIYADDPSTLAERREWWRERRARNFPVLVAVDAKGVAGFSSFGDFRAFPNYRHTVEHSVHVRSDMRGRGVGAALVEALFPYALALQKHVMVGGIDAENAVSLRMHERLGFERVAYMPEVGHKFGRWLDLIFVQKRF